MTRPCDPVAVLGKFRSEERVAIEKDGRKAEDGAVFLAEFLDGLFDDRQVRVRFLFDSAAGRSALRIR